MNFKGVLTYHGWARDWFVHGDGGRDFLLRRAFMAFVTGNANKRASLDYERDLFSLNLDDKSPLTLESPGDRVNLINQEAFGFSSVDAYLDHALISLNARPVIVASEADRFTIQADSERETTAFRLRYTAPGNSCRIPEGAIREVCKVGTSDCCIFVTCGPDGFRCDKFNPPTARYLLERYASGGMNASRIGDCRCVGREPE